MSEINYKDLKNYLKDRKKEPFAPAYLVYGEEYLYKRAFGELLDAMVPVSKRSLNYEPVDGADCDIFDVIERLNTFSFFSGTTVVALHDARIFHSKEDSSKILERAKAAYDQKDMEKAAKSLASLLALMNFSFKDIKGENIREVLKIGTDGFGGDDWLDEVAGYCIDEGVSLPVVEDNAKVLQRAIEKGFPKGNHLIITTDLADKRRGLFKAIKKNGVIIDCSVPKGDRKADKDAQKAVLYETMNAILAQNRKRMDTGAYHVLYEMTGFDLRTFSGNLEKLVNFVGDRESITLDDVKSVLKRTRQDPLYELTGAIADKNREEALFYMDSLLQGEFHPLQILAAITNQIRKLLLVKGFAESSQGDVRYAGVQFNYFKTNIMPAILEYDKLILNQLEEWKSLLSENKDGSGKAGKKSRNVTDLVIVKNPNNPYPVYLMLLKSERFTKEELVDALECLNRADLKLKTSAQTHKLVLEEAVIHICRRGRWAMGDRR
jgi:DNA polymerase-3 subunit delta